MRRPPLTASSAALAATALLAAAPAPAAAAGGFELIAAKVRPADAYFAGRPLIVRFETADARGRRLRVVIIEKETRAVVKRWKLSGSTELTRHRLRWRGRSGRGAIAANGSYVVRAGPAGRPTRRVGRFGWRRHAFPVAGRHGSRGYIGEFGAPRSGGRTHRGYDVTAACGTRLRVARGGKVMKVRYDGRLNGHYVVIRGRRNGIRYLYAHLRERSPLREGDKARTGQLLGRVGQSGNAASTPCHLHIELRRNGRFLDPEPHLRRWSR